MDPRSDRTFLGVDYGRKRVGLAISDPAGILASPLAVLSYRGMDDLAARLSELAFEREAVAIVLGLPTRADGRAGDLAAEIEALAEKLRSRGVAVIFSDESLTTWEAGRLLGEAGADPRAGRKAKIDAAAAAVMLQSYLEDLDR